MQHGRQVTLVIARTATSYTSELSPISVGLAKWAATSRTATTLSAAEVHPKPLLHPWRKYCTLLFYRSDHFPGGADSK